MSNLSLREAQQHAQAHARRILDAVRQGARAAGDDDVMASSWTRCLNEHRLHPDHPRRPSIVSAAELAERQNRLADVLDCARYEMSTLYQQLGDTESAVVLTDTDGVILHMVSSSAFAADVTALGFHVGAVWSEAEAGTNGMGTCLVAASPVAVQREDHFFTELTSLTCSAVPVFDPQGQMTAVLDVTSRSSLQQQHSLVLLGMTAQMIENRLMEQRFPEAHLLHFHSRPEFVYTLHEGKLALDGNGRILAGNRSALFQLGLRSVAELRSKRLDELLQTPLAEIEQRSLRSAYHPVVSYGGAQGASRFFVVARPPAGDLELAGVPALQPRRDPPRADPKRETATAPRSATAPAPSFGDRRLAEQLEAAARAIARDIPVLLHGETGSGKEVFARALHAASPKAGGALVAINCASLPETLIEAELFGYRAGAFTGAQRSGRRGKIVEADRGTLFLDEIGDMPLALQARLLRVLDERKVTPLGAEETVEVDFQLVSASHHPLEALVAEGRFRQDLYYRLAGFEVTLPALRERSDRRALIGELLAQEGGNARLAPDALALLEQHPWPGNVRQLKHVLRTAVALAGDDGLIGPEHLVSLRQRAATATPAPASAAFADGAAPNADNGAPALPPLNPIQAKEREVLLQLLEQHRWNVSNVAKALDVSRNTLYRKLHRLHIALSTAVGHTPPGATDAQRWAAALGDEHAPATQDPPRSRFAWCVTGSGHYLEESMALAARLPQVDLFLSAAADEVLPLYGLRLEVLKERFRVFRDKSASAVPVGRLYLQAYHTVVIAPATSNTVAKCALGISDTLPTNMLAQAGKLGVPSLVFACDTEPVVITKGPRTTQDEWFTLRPRNIDLAHVERLREIDHCEVFRSPDELEAALTARLAALNLAWL